MSEETITLVDPVGPIEIAAKLDVSKHTVYSWIQRDLFPPPASRISDRPVWEWETIRLWAVETGRFSE